MKYDVFIATSNSPVLKKFAYLVLILFAFVSFYYILGLDDKGGRALITLNKGSRLYLNGNKLNPVFNKNSKLDYDNYVVKLPFGEHKFEVSTVDGRLEYFTVWISKKKPKVFIIESEGQYIIK